MERKIGEIFEHNGEWYQCVEGNGCENCAFKGRKCYIEGGTDDLIGECCYNRRNDNIDVIFKKLEKVGEPFSCDYYGDSPIMMQEYNLYNLNDVTNEDNIPMYITDYRHKRIAIEIKQTKEDMEEKKIQHYDCFFDKKLSKPNLKPFDLEAAKAGKPICTRDGRKARIICFDARFSKTGNIVTLVEIENGEEVTLYHYDDGHCSIGRGYDLMMLLEKKEGWVNVYDDMPIYDTKERAKLCASTVRKHIATVKIDWEE